MKTTHIYFLALAMAVAAIMSGCTKTSFEEPVPEAGTMTATVRIASPEDDATKVSVSDNGTTWSVQWQKGDELGGWSSGKTAFERFTMTTFTDASGKSAAFVGSSSTRLLYPYMALASISSGKVAVDMSHRYCDIDVPFYKMSDKGYMVSDFLTAAAEFSDVQVHNLMSGLKVKLTFSNIPADQKLLRVELTGQGGTTIYTGAKINLAETGEIDKVLTDKTTGTISISVGNSPVLANETYTVSTFAVPSSFKVGAANAVKVKVCLSDGYKEFDIAPAADKEMVRSAYYTLNCACDMSGTLSAYTTWLGAGTQDDPYIIATKADLKLLASKVNAGNPYSAIYFKMTGDIDLAGTSSDQWTPIGTDANKFSGEFDGDGHSVNGLYVDASTSDYQGLFGNNYVAAVSNLSVSGSVVGKSNVGGICGYSNGGSFKGCTFSGSVSGTEYLGGIVGYSASAMTDCSNQASITASSAYSGGICGYASDNVFTSCSNSGGVSGTQYIGGIVGKFEGSSDSAVNDCVNSGSIVASVESSRVGGICGWNYGAKLTNCLNSGDVTGYSVAGGISGYNNGAIVNCVNLGAVSTTTAIIAGGISGSNHGSGYSIRNCLSYGSVKSVGVYAGAISGDYIASGPTFTGNYYLTGCAKDGSGIVQNAFGTDNATTPLDNPTGGGVNAVVEATMTSLTELVSSANTMLQVLNLGAQSYNSGTPTPSVKACAWSQVTGDYPTLMFGVVPGTDGSVTLDSWLPLASPNFAGGTGTAANPYLISSPTELAHLADIVNNNVVTGNQYAGAFFKLACDIDLTGKSWVPIGTSGNKFAGTFDGAGHSVKGLLIDTPKKMNVGLFGCATGATFKNLSVFGSVTGYSHTGGICGLAANYNIGSDYYYSSFSNCHNHCVVTSPTLSEGTGGIAGYLVGSTADCINRGKVTGYESVGGLIGKQQGNNDRGVNYASVSGKSSVGGICGDGGVINCYNYARIVAVYEVGGLVGYGAAVNSFNSGSVRATGTSGSNDICYAGGIVGLSNSSIRNCLNVGSVSGVKYYVGSIVGASGTSTYCCNCYYRKGSALNGDGHSQEEEGDPSDSNSSGGLTSDQLLDGATISTVSVFRCDGTTNSDYYYDITLTAALNYGVTAYTGSAIAYSSVAIKWSHTAGSYPTINF